MPVAIQILVILIVLFNFFVLFMCAKRWRIVHVVCTFLVFAAAIAFVYFTTMSLKTHMSWKRVVRDSTKEFDAQQKTEGLLKNGDIEKNVEVTEASLLGAKAAVEQEQYDRGRVWANCVPGRFDGRAVTVNTFTPDPAAPPDAPVLANHMADKMIMFAFKEGDIYNAGFKVPYMFLGEFVASGVTDTSVTLAPTLPLDPAQTTAINTADATWVLYEVMPVDQHDTFIYSGAADKASGKRFDRATVSAILKSDEKKVVDAYLYDLLPVREIENLDKDFAASLTPDRIWLKVKFSKPHTIEVDSTDAPVADKTFFDSSGRALPLSLRQGEKTSFGVGEFATFDRDSANEMISNGLCEKVDEIYVRPLENYEHHFHEIDKRVKQIAQDSAVVSVDLANTQAAKANSQKQVDSRQKEKDSLLADVRSVNYERGEVTKYRLALEAAFAKKKNALSELYRTNNALAAQLAAMQKKIADDLEKPAEGTALEPISVPSP